MFVVGAALGTASSSACRVTVGAAPLPGGGIGVGALRPLLTALSLRAHDARHVAAARAARACATASPRGAAACRPGATRRSTSAASGATIPTHVEHNRRRLAAAGGFELERLFTAQQVHGARVAVVVEGVAARARRRDRGRRAGRRWCPASSSASTPPTACRSCSPTATGASAAAHAGWRGTVAGRRPPPPSRRWSPSARDRETHPRRARSVDLRALLRSRRRGGGRVRRASRPRRWCAPRAQKPHVDLWDANRALLVAAGARARATSTPRRRAPCASPSASSPSAATAPTSASTCRSSSPSH